ncbi:chemotaxis protein CheW [Cognatilysobacter terrigena]|uniref:chemotaxis protein CheW n=1 Tax=Cognatilysobacter terrigena TaxID=2488749 RepID=UPI001FE82204|nr:chemotaxis protein CheW [Lysobacter terrigena]
MSKKKNRHRRPNPPQGQVAVAPHAQQQAVDSSDELDGAEDVEDIDTPDAEAESVVDVVLSQASALGAIEPDAGEAMPAPAASAAPSNSTPTWMQQETGDIRGVLIQVAGGRLLLPNATIAEVLSYAEPESDGSGVDWLLGRFRWRGWQIPLIAFSRMAGIGEDKPGLGTKVIVLKALGSDRRIPFFAIVTQGFPRLVTVSRTALSIESQDGDMPSGVQAYVRLNDEPALLPDLLQIEQRLREAREAA